MKITVMSDIHLEYCRSESDLPKLSKGDVLVLAGDIAVIGDVAYNYNGCLDLVDAFFRRCSKNYDLILYVFGNHEYYSTDILNVSDSFYFKYLNSNFPKIKVLNNDYVELDNGWVVLGSTLWTSINSANPMDMLAVKTSINDYRRIYYSDNLITPEDVVKLNSYDFNWISRMVHKFNDKNIIVVTHHSPSTQSTHPKYKHSNLNCAYSNNYDQFILDNDHIKFWVHGHTHDKFDYQIGGCNVICNPRGYISFENIKKYVSKTIVLED